MQGPPLLRPMRYTEDFIPERIGQVLITASEANETKQTSKTEKAPDSKASSIESSQPLSIAKHVETMSRENILELSSKILVDGSSLRQMYETHLIGERALRRLIVEHLSGGNLREALRDEIIQHEIDFERDPMIRDRTHQNEPSDTNDVSNIDYGQDMSGTGRYTTIKVLKNLKV